MQHIYTGPYLLTRVSLSQPYSYVCNLNITTFYNFFWHKSPQWAKVSSFTRFLDHTQRLTTLSRTSLDEGSARRRDLYLTTHNTHNKQTSVPPVGFEPIISAGERQETYALDRAATGTVFHNLWGFEIFYFPTRIDIYAHQFFFHTIVFTKHGKLYQKKTHNSYLIHHFRL